MKPMMRKYIWLLGFLGVLPGLCQGQQWQGSCYLGGNSSYPVNVSLVSSTGTPLDSIQSGIDFNLNISLPGLSVRCPNGSYTVSIQTSDNLVIGSQPPSSTTQFTQTTSTPLVYSNSTPISTNNGIGFNVPFHFLPGTTCNRELGTFKVKIKTSCGDSCVVNVSLRAIAKNYWKVTKQRIWGNLSGGYVLWRIVVQNTNPNPGIGDLNIYSGTLQDVVSGTSVITAVSASGVTGLGTNTATWNTGFISVYSYYVFYDVWTKSCDSAGTLIQNCVNYSFCLGKPTVGVGNPSNPNPSPTARTVPSPSSTVQIPQPNIKLCCDYISGQACDTVTLVKEPNYSICFDKTRPNAQYINWTQGCEEFYHISACGNCGSNVPLDSIVITDTFPSGIQVTSMTISSPLSGTLQVGSSTFSISAGTPQTISFSSPPSNFVFTTTPGQTLLNQCITIDVKFTITAPAGTTVKNCAHINYTNASFSDTVNNCGQFIPGSSYQGAAISCDSFIVQQPKPIPFIKKCIRNGQQSYNVGDVIPFQIVVINHGSAPLTGYTLNDFLGSPQNLQLVPGSVSYTYGMGSFNVYYPWNCFPNIPNPIHDTTPPSWVTNTSTPPQNLIWSISGMPGSCYLDSAYYLIIQFDAVVLPQSFGNYINTATLNGPGYTANSSAPYNVLRIAKLDVTKKVGLNGQWGNSGYVNPGQNFQYQISLCNVGSVALNHLQVQDALPACVSLLGCSGYVLDAQGQQHPISGMSCTAPNFSFPTSTAIQPGECAVLILQVQRKPQDTSAQCCNPLARGKGTSTDAVLQTIQDEDGPVCVKSAACCDLERFNIKLQTQGIAGSVGNFSLWVTAGNLPIQEIDISLMDVHVQYTYPDCKPAQLGDHFMHLTTTANTLGGALVLTNPNPPFVNHQLTWGLGTPLNMNTGVNIPLSLVLPNSLSVPCCSALVYFCLKVHVKDVNCRECEKVVCGFFTIQPAGGQPGASSIIQQQVGCVGCEQQGKL
ncbi:MAG: DUF11 domain-containing protein [Thermoflavifilum sp.]|nr:DUF11 domain-containing protein [Thermoflavifilum sp.]